MRSSREEEDVNFIAFAISPARPPTHSLANTHTLHCTCALPLSAPPLSFLCISSHGLCAISTCMPVQPATSFANFRDFSYMKSEASSEHIRVGRGWLECAVVVLMMHRLPIRIAQNSSWSNRQTTSGQSATINDCSLGSVRVRSEHCAIACR